MITHTNFCDRCHESGSDKFAVNYSQVYLCDKCVGWDKRQNNFKKYIKHMEDSIVEYLMEFKNGYGLRKWAISENTGIPEDILTVLLKRLKDKKIIEIIRIFSEDTLLANGSGYCLDFDYRKILEKFK
jgi:hypothetical protein